MLKFKKIPEWLGVLLIVIAVFIVAYFIGHCSKLQNKISDIKTVQSAKDAPVQHSTDINGDDHAEKPVAIGDMDALLSVYESTIDSQARLLNIQAKQIKALNQVTTETKGSIINGTAADFTPIDVHAAPEPCPEQISWKNNWAFIKAFKKSNDWKVEYELKDTLTTVTYQKKKGWFKNETWIDMRHSNPYVVIQGIQSLQVAVPKPKKFGLGVNVSYSFVNNQFRPVVGFGLQYNLIRF